MFTCIKIIRKQAHCTRNLAIEIFPAQSKKKLDQIFILISFHINCPRKKKSYFARNLINEQNKRKRLFILMICIIMSCGDKSTATRDKI